ncbi:MAG TPA: hypothetical protein VEC11_06845 [Allosphingosinicella sp.]|nr:hypothetical protein [Allosphingosinicella sp.]
MLKEIEDYWGAENATRSGMYGALGYAGVVVFSTILLLLDQAGVQFSWLDGGMQAFLLAILGAQLGVAVLAAWRFSMGKGLIPGAITLGVFLLNLIVSVANGAIPGIIWWVAYAAIIIGLINGLRGAWAMRTMEHPGDVVETFE